MKSEALPQRLDPVDETELLDLRGQIDAISRSNAVIEFELDGTIRTANDNFLAVTGYTLDEITGQHHRMFVAPEDSAKPGYDAFWRSLGAGEFHSGEYRRVAKDGSEIFIQASYNPIFDANGQPYKVVKYASDVTADKLLSADFAGQIAAISRSQAVIEFDLEGHVLNANENFLATLGYTLDEIKGRHHRMFVTEEEANSPEYADFWRSLAGGAFHSGEYHRLRKDGTDVFIQASYNAILDLNGAPWKVVKYASDITENVRARKSAAEMARSLNAASAELREVSETMTSSVRRNSARTKEASEASDSVSSHALTLAAATEQMSACINDIARSTSEAARFGEDASNAARETNATVEKLGVSSAEIGVVTRVITSIAEQTNLLALNATIEAARAGEAGRGFAVVASEVKELARETAKATADITKKVAAIQGDSGRSAEEIARIGKIIEDLNGIQTSIAGAVEEQTNTTSEMSRSVTEASGGMASVATSLGDLSSSATDLENGAAAAEDSAERLAAMAAELEALVDRF